MNGPIKSDSNEQGSRFDWMESGIVFAGVLVVVGLLMESWPEIRSAAIEGRFPRLSVTGGIIVTVGVLIEVVLGIFITQRANRIQSESNERAANALARAGKAEQAAAEANLARVRIEEQLFKPHVLTDAARHEIVEILKQFEGHKRVDVFVYDQHITEVFQLADSLNATFRSAGWLSQMWIGDEPRIMGKEVTFSLARECAEDSQMQELAGRLSAVLFKLDIGSCVSLGGFSIGSPIPVLKPLGGWGIRKQTDIVLLRVQVGQRQLTSDLFVRPPQA
jgi:hypothetical protein